MESKRSVLLIYTGGTVGMVRDIESGHLAPFDFNNLESQIPEIKQIEARVEAISFEKPIDSSNMDLKHWTKLAGILENNYDKYDGFVVLHGSDTMAYTAS